MQREPRRPFSLVLEMRQPTGPKKLGSANHFAQNILPARNLVRTGSDCSCLASASILVADTISKFRRYPALPFLSVLGNVESVPVGILASLLSLALLGAIWGFLIYYVTGQVESTLQRASLLQRRQIKFGAWLLSIAIAASVVAFTFPATPISFTPSPEIKTVVDGNNTFALDLYQQLKDRPGNIFFSPFSISTALAMTSAGARGQTEREMTNVLHLDLPPEKLHPAFKRLIERMDKVQRWNRIILKSANSLWIQKDYPFNAAFSRLLDQNYFAQAKSIDFKNGPAAANEINQLVERKTSGRISSIVPAGHFSRSTRLVLCDALYFKGKWQHQFKQGDTKHAPFHVSTNHTVTVPMMRQKAHFKISGSDDGSVQLLELPYVGKDLSMIILLPEFQLWDRDVNEPGFSDLEKKLTPENLQPWLRQLDKTPEHEAWVSLPRFTTTQTFDLVPELNSLGVKSAFNHLADFAGIDNSTNLFISNVMHTAFVDVNESGTEAAAITMITVATKSMTRQFIVDHPFIFLIRENASGTILFLGRITDPTK